MFKKLLCPTDFSETAAKSIPYIKKLMSAGAEEIVLVNVIHQRILDSLETIHLSAYYQDGRYHEDKEAAEERIKAERVEKMAPLAAELEAAGFKVKIKIEKGYPVKEILRIEKEENVSAVVMGSHGKSNIRDAFMGSVSEKVMRRAISPVLVVKR